MNENFKVGDEVYYTYLDEKDFEDWPEDIIDEINPTDKTFTYHLRWYGWVNNTEMRLKIKSLSIQTFKFC